MTLRLKTKFVKTRILDYNLSMRDLAAKAGIGEATMYRISNGAPFELETLGKLAEALECSPLDLLEVTGYPAPLMEAPAVSS